MTVKALRRQLVTRYFVSFLFVGFLYGLLILLIDGLSDFSRYSFATVILFHLALGQVLGLLMLASLGLIALLGKKKPFYLKSIILTSGMEQARDLCIVALRGISATQVEITQSDTICITCRVGEWTLLDAPSRFVFKLQPHESDQVEVIYYQVGFFGTRPIKRDDFDRVSASLDAGYRTVPQLTHKDASTASESPWKAIGLSSSSFPWRSLLLYLILPFILTSFIIGILDLSVPLLLILISISLVMIAVAAIYILKVVSLDFLDDLLSRPSEKLGILHYVRQGTLLQIAGSLLTAYLLDYKPQTSTIRQRRETLLERLRELVSNEHSPKLYAMICLDLAHHLVQSDRAMLDDYARGIGYAKEGLRFLPPNPDNAHLRITAHALLGQAYLESSLISARDELTAQAVLHIESARALRHTASSPEEDGIDSALLNGLGLAYLRLGSMALDKAEYLSKAVTTLNEALELTPEDDSAGKGVCHANLGMALLFWTDYDAPGDDSMTGEHRLDLAIDHLKQALGYWQPHSGHSHYARIHLNLATAFLKLRTRHAGRPSLTLLTVSGSERSDATVESILSHYQEACRFLSPQDHLYEWTNLHNYMGNFFRSQHAHDSAIACYQRGLACIAEHEVPETELMLRANLADLYFLQNDWHQAWRAYDAAMEVYERVYHNNASMLFKTNYLSRTARSYRRCAYAAYQVGQLQAALDSLDRGRTRTLIELISLELEDPREEIPSQLWSQYNAEKASLKRALYSPISTAESNLDGLAESVDASQKARSGLQEAVAAIQTYDPTFLSEETAALGSLDEVLTESSAIVSFCVTDQGSAALLRVKDGPVQAIPLDIDQEQITSLFGIYEASSKRNLVAVLHQIGTAVVQPVTSSLPAHITQLLLTLDGELLLLPLHAAPLGPGGDVCLSDRYAVAYTPSLRLLCKLRQKRSGFRKPNKRALVVANPTLDLPYTLSESLGVAQHIDECKLIWEKQATKQSVVKCFDQLRVLHFACHGQYNAQDPTESGVVLASSTSGSADTRSPQGDLFTVAEIAGSINLSGTDLVVLSGCESGMARLDHQLSGEYIGLAGSLLQAGARAVLATLWPVDDCASALLMGRFYREWSEGAIAIAEALRRAQRWLRTLSRDEVDAALQDLLAFWEPWANQADDAAMQSRAAEQDWVIKEARHRLHEKDDRPFADPQWWASFQAVGDVL